MTRLDFDASWVSDSGHERPEIASTLAWLRIEIDDEPVTLAHDRSARVTRASILVPLYPIAEWIAANWWALNEESDVPLRSSFLARHSLLCGRGGYCLPDLRIIREGLRTRLEWHRHTYTHAPVEFLSCGVQYALASDVEASLRDLVGMVDAKLRNEGIVDSWLQAEWASIQATEANAPERAFCMAAAWLGVDPFEASGDMAETIESFWELPDSVREEALRASNADDAAQVLDWVRQGLQSSVEGANLDDRVRKTVLAARDPMPWKAGYDAARALHSQFPVLAHVPVPIEQCFGGVLPIIAAPESPRNVHGLMINNGTTACYTARRRPESQRYLVARAIFDPDNPSALLTSARTERQSASRAFAAELLAPARLLRERMPGRELTSEDVAELADAFAVSTFVIEHQLRNHGLASIVPDDPVAPKPALP